ncbi:IS630 family transposase [Pseudomonas rhodesiae]|uniref:IS630 family transposase n=1 Tax=Pseudomonas rhodesiae TaxID=76760 RepID=UPI00289BAA05|nr:IS630 family transposase [Pseudomonas rhodesiae]
MLMKSIPPLCDTDLQALNNAYRQSEKLTLRRRAHAILLSHKGYTLRRISDILDVTRPTISIWLDAWKTEGLQGLNDKPRTGRPVIYDEQDRERLKALVSEEPHQIKAVQARLQQETGKTSCTMTIKRALKKAGYSFKRARRSLKERRDETDFRNTQSLLQELWKWEDREEAELYYFDESGFSQVSSLLYAWSPVGQPLELPAFSHSRRLNVLGFLSRQGKLVYHTTTDTVTTPVVIEAFDRLLEQKSPQAFAIVVLDNASIHRSALFKSKELEWRAQRLYVIFLPPYSPELNLIEMLWKKIKYEWLPVTAYQSFQLLTDHVLNVLSGYGDRYRISFV